jgi:hypothetical protein
MPIKTCVTKLSRIPKSRDTIACVPAASGRWNSQLATTSAASRPAIDHETPSHFARCRVSRHTYRSCDIARLGQRKKRLRHVLNSWQSVNEPSHRNRRAVGHRHLYAADHAKIGALVQRLVINSGPNRSSTTSDSTEPLLTGARVQTPARRPWCGKPRPPLGFSLRRARSY